jgi:hypothetical protein
MLELVKCFASINEDSNNQMKIKIRAQAKVKIKSFENADLSAIMFDVKIESAGNYYS